MCRRTSVRSRTTSKPATRALPAVGCSRVQRILMVVDLPAPFGPRKPKSSPVRIARSMPRTASIWSKVLTRPLASTAGGRSIEVSPEGIPNFVRVTSPVFSNTVRVSRVPISRNDVVRAAIEVIDDEGLAGLTLRGVAARLGVSAPTLYWHVKDKRHLLDLIADQVMAEVPETRRAPREGESISDWLAESLRARRALLLAHRDSVRVVAGNRPTEDAMPGIEQTLRVLVDAGLEPGEAVRVLTALGSFLLGDVLETQATQERPLEEPPTGDFHRFPTLAAAARTIGGQEERLEEGLSLLLDGLHARLERRRASASSAAEVGPA